MDQISAKVVTLVGECLDVVSCQLEQYLKELGTLDMFGGMQISADVGMTHVFQKTGLVSKHRVWD